MLEHQQTPPKQGSFSFVHTQTSTGGKKTPSEKRFRFFAVDGREPKPILCKTPPQKDAPAHFRPTNAIDLMHTPPSNPCKKPPAQNLQPLPHSSLKPVSPHIHIPPPRQSLFITRGPLIPPSCIKPPPIPIIIPYYHFIPTTFHLISYIRAPRMIGGLMVAAAVTALGAQTLNAGGVIALQNGKTGVAVSFGGSPTAESFGDGVVGDHDGTEEERCHDVG